MTRRIVGPFNRVEGDLEVSLDIKDGIVAAAWVNSPLYRGFEQMLSGRNPSDALVMTPRICGICSVAQSMASAIALADAQRLTAPPNGELMRNIILATENVADHLTHFYLFFMPDFARPVYQDESWYQELAPRFTAVSGDAIREMLPSRAAFMHIMGSLAGHWPHTLGLQPGGTTHAIDGATQARVLAILAAFRRFLETRLFGDTLEAVAELDSGAALDAWRHCRAQARSDFAAFLRLCDALDLNDLGRTSNPFMSYGAYEVGGSPFLRRGVFEGGKTRPLDASAISEDISNAWYAKSPEPRHPTRGLTIPDSDMTAGYTWCKAPRLAGKVVEVGALARQAVDGHALILDLVTKHGGNVATRVVARLIEIARVVPQIETWTRSINPSEPFYFKCASSDEAQGAGLIEAARGSLGHWVSIKNGRIANYQIIAPTTWNFSPRDSAGTPGACEQALAGAPVRQGETDPIAVQHIVRSFDPCMVCTVH
ncbi:MAG: nickel-dependent hydrogenase large subunit [Hyphomicrobium sp.]|jgi:hydrogenase large subunit